MRVLIADDDCVSRHLLEKALTDWGYETEPAADGDEAWRVLLNDQAPPLVILDWTLPGLDGPEICRRIRHSAGLNYSYVLVVAAHATKQNLLDAFEAGADDFVAMPCDLDELQARVRAGERIVNLQTESTVALNSLRKQATHDSLTGALNRSAIMRELNRELVRAGRMGSPVGVILIDVDHFKGVNDNYGHLAGDQVLSQIVTRMASCIRSYELIGRFGGDELLVVLSNCDFDTIQTVGERLRETVSDRKFEIPGAKITVTMTLGGAVAASARQMSQADLLELADTALYRAKQEGRNRLVIADPTELAPINASAGDSGQ